MAQSSGCTWLEPGRRGESCGKPAIIESVISAQFPGSPPVRRCKRHSPPSGHINPTFWKEVKENTDAVPNE